MRVWKLKILVLSIILLSFQISFGQKAEAKLVESSEYINSEMGSLHIDMLMNELQHVPNGVGYIVIYGGKVNKVGEIEAHLRGLNQAFNFKRIDKGRIKIIQGGFREKLMLDFWVVPPDACPPIPTPAIEIEKVKFRRVSRKIIPYQCC
jgi:hypothetical protein